MSDKYPRVALIGGGKMGRAIVQGIIRAGFTRAIDVSVGEPSASSRQWWAENEPKVAVSSDNRTAVEAAEIVVIAVKPPAVVAVLSDLKKTAKKSIVVSVAAGVDLDTLAKGMGGSRVVRVMPNTPCLVGQGASAFCCGDEISSEEAGKIEAMLSSIGLAVAVPEPWLDAVTGLSGSGPAFVCLVIESLADGGVLAGLPRELALQLATQTVLGTASLVAETHTHPAVLKDAVASPGGTTIAGIAALEKAGLRSAIISAVKAASDRSQQMGTK